MLELLLSRRFGPLFVTQFLAAFSDNFLKNALVFLLVFKVGGAQADLLVTLAGAVFILPFFFLSGLGGELADRFDKAVVARWLKLIEIGPALVACLGYALGSVPILYAALFAYGVMAALFGPIKYGILPDHLAARDLPAGNALIEGATFVAILTGTIAGGLVAQAGGGWGLFTVLNLGFAVACYVVSRSIPPTGAAAPGIAVRANLLASTAALIRELRQDGRLLMMALAISHFWAVGVVVMALVPSFLKRLFHADEAVVTLHFALFALAIGVGSLIGARLMAGRIRLWPAPITGAVMGLAALDLGWSLAGISAPALPMGLAAFFSEPAHWRVSAALAVLAMAGGAYVVPTFAAAQVWAPVDRRARVVGAVNVCNAGFMVAASLALAGMQAAGLAPAVILVAIGIVNLSAALWLWLNLPADPA
jgi:acyl-[acyl-carrier-protein]-phospholipid O-acyltransferase/long-chain-fatty-acid--[acyl-carrier-protein] ligase